MTPHPSRFGSRALLSTALAVAVTALCAPVAMAAPGPSTSTPVVEGAAARPAATTATTDVTVSAAPADFGVVAAGQPLAVTVTVRNSGGSTLAPASATVRLSSASLADSVALKSWMDSGLSPAFRTVAAGGLPEVTAAGEATGVVTIPAEELADLPPGVYALEVGVDTVPASVRTVLTVPEAAPADVPVAALVAVTAGPRTVGLLDEEELSSLTASAGRLTLLLDAVEGHPEAVMAVDPAILASIRVLGESAPESAIAWLARLEALPHERFALQFGDADLTTQAEAGLQTPLAPTGLDYALPSSSAAADDEPGEPAPLSLEELLLVEGAHEGVSWPADGATSPDALERMSDWTDGAATVFVSSASVEPASAAGAMPLTDGVTGVVYDDLASEVLFGLAGGDGRALTTSPETGSDDITGTTGTGAASGAPAAVTPAPEADETDEVDESALFDDAGDLAVLTGATVLAADGATAPVVIATDRPMEVGPGLADALDAISAAPGTRSATLHEAIQPAATASAVTATGSAPRGWTAALTEGLSAEDELARTATTLQDPLLLTAPERTALLQLVGAGWSADPVGWRRASTQYEQRMEVLADAIEITPSPTIQLYSAAAGIPFYIRNDLDWPATVTLEASPGGYLLAVENRVDVVADRRSVTRVEVPVRARVGNGEMTIDLTLVSPAGEVIGPRRTVEVAVRADWERVGLIALGSVVAILLVLGVIRTLVRRRRRSLADTHADADSDAESSPGLDPEAPPAERTDADG